MVESGGTDPDSPPSASPGSPPSSPPSAEDRYLDAARACILDVGWRRTTLTEVARRAGVSRMTIYRTWADMPTLMSDLMTREWAGVVGETLSRPGRDEADLSPGALALDFAATVAALRENELFVRIVELDPELLLPYLLSRRGRSQEAVIGIIAARIAEAQATGAVRAGAPVVIARALLLAAHGFVFSVHTMVDEAAGEGDLDAELVGLVERMLRPEPATPPGTPPGRRSRP